MTSPKTMLHCESSSVFSALRDEFARSRAWLSPFVTLANRIERSDGSTVAEALNEARAEGAAVKFVAQSALPAGEPYESFIARTFCVPTRDNMHDLCNGLVWLTFPKTKRHINRLQASEIVTHGVSGARGALRDALTVFDENGALLQAPPELTNALRDRDWHALFATHRALWRTARLTLFGHALLEKLMQPRKSMTAHVWVVEDLTDESLAASLDPGKLVTKPFLPLPVLGVPGWWKENEQPEFYVDPATFRPRS